MIQALDPRSSPFYLGLFENQRVLEYLHALRMHSQEAYEHNIRTGLMCVDMGHGVGIDNESMLLLGNASILHDFGKKDITLEILAKPGKLSPDEIMVMHGHVRLGFIALDGFGDERVRCIIARHHEYKKHSPYPRSGTDRRAHSREGEERRCADAQVDYLAQFLAAADVLDSLAHKRAYKDALPKDEVEAILREDFTGDPMLVDEALRRGVF